MGVSSDARCGHGVRSESPPQDQRLARARAHTHTPHRISAFLPNKSTCDCVQFYYQNKKCKYFKQVPGHV